MTAGQRVLEIAAREIGVKESPANSNRVKYNTWYYGSEVSGAGYPWCMAFVQWVYHQAGIPLPKKTASCGALLNWYFTREPACVHVDGMSNWTPEAGDIVIFDFPGTAYNTDHTGILEGLGRETVTTIDGNTGTNNEANGGAVMRRTRSRQLVKAYIRPRALWKEDKMSGEEIYRALSEYLLKQELPDWARQEYGEAVALGLTDGTNPCLPVPRYQAALMAKRAYELGRKEARHG